MLPARPVALMQGLSDLSLCEGDIAQFEVRFSQPGVEGFWFKDGQPVQTTERVHVVLDKQAQMLLVEDASKEDAGSYAFKAPEHDLKTSCQLTVKSKMMYF